MFSSLGQYVASVPLVLRVGLGATQVFAHGLPKLMEPERWEATGRAMANVGITFAPAFWGFMAGAMETVCGLLLIVGLFVRPSCVVLLWIMFVAAVQNIVAAGSLAGGRAHPIDAGVGLLALLILGAGAYSLERKFGWESAKPNILDKRQPARAV